MVYRILSSLSAFTIYTLSNSTEMFLTQSVELSRAFSTGLWTDAFSSILLTTLFMQGSQMSSLLSWFLLFKPFYRFFSESFYTYAGYNNTEQCIWARSMSNWAQINITLFTSRKWHTQHCAAISTAADCYCYFYFTNSIYTNVNTPTNNTHVYTYVQSGKKAWNNFENN